MVWTRSEIAERIARDIEPGWMVNLGIGIPTLVTLHLDDPSVMFQSENGILGLGPPPAEGEEDPDIVDAGKNPSTVVPGGSFFDSLTSFTMIRGGHLDLAVMGAYQVSARGDLANWRLPGRSVGGIGGAADLAVGAKRMWIAMEHSSKEGEPRLLARCEYPVTAHEVVDRIYTDLGIFEPGIDGRVRIRELAPGLNLDDVRAASGRNGLRFETTTAAGEVSS